MQNFKDLVYQKKSNISLLLLLGFLFIFGSAGSMLLHGLFSPVVVSRLRVVVSVAAEHTL